MFKGKVVTEFVDRHTRRHYRSGDVYATKSEERRDEIIAVGEASGVVYVKFEETKKPTKPKGEKGKKGAEGDKSRQADAVGDNGSADDNKGSDTKGDDAKE